MSLKFMGKKRGMVQLFDDKGNAVACTVIEAAPNVVVQIKTKETDGYNAIQLGFEEIEAKDSRRKEARTKKPQRAHFAKANAAPSKYLAESRVENPQEYQLGQKLTLSAFDGIAFIDATAMSKGKGYQGVMKLYNYSGGPAAHGSGFHRHAGSTGMRSTPGRCLPGGKRASHMGYDRKTVQNLQVISIDADENLLIVKGAVPGPNDGLVYISQAVKKTHPAKKSS